MEATLKLEPCDLNSASQDVIAARLRTLRAIQIANHSDLTDHGVQELLTRCPNLERIELQNCPQLGDATLHYLCETNPHLRLLSWTGCNSATEQGYLHFATHSPSLRTLNLSGTQFTSQACQTLLASNTSLSALDLSFCSLDDTSFASLSAPLQFLNLQGCASLTDQTLLHLSKSPALRHLFLAYNTNLTPNGLRLLSNLQTLRISHCPNL